MKNLVKFLNILNSTFSNKRGYVRGKRSYPSSHSFKNTIGSRGSRYNFNSLKYQESTKPQHYGPGRTERNVESFINISPNSYVNISGLLVNSREFQLLKVMYNYFKIYNLAIVFYANQAEVQAGNIPFQVDWNGTNNTDIKNEDNTKVVGVYRTSSKIFKFTPPNMPILTGGSNTLAVFNYFNFFRTDDYINIPGKINFGDGSYAEQIKIVFKVLFVGGRIPPASSVSNMVAQLEKIEKNINIKNINYKNLLDDENNKKEPQIENKVVALISEVDNVMRENNDPPLKLMEPIVIKERVPEIIPRREYIGTITHSVAQAENKDTKGDVFSKGFPDYCLIGKETLSLNKKEDTGGGRTFSRK